MKNDRKIGGARAMKTVAIEQVVSEVLDSLHAGREVDYAAIERANPDLMPELGTRFALLRGVNAAAQKARSLAQSDKLNDQSSHPQYDDIRLLSETLTGYRILERMDDGGQGVVYKAVQRSTKRTVVIKVLLDGPLALERQRHRFEREVELLSRLHHPNIVTIYESGVVRGRQFFAMEFVDGLPIDDYVLVNARSVRAIVLLLRVVCDAVSAAHQRGIIHRDLKPSNILVDPDGQPHVLDFGLAKEIESWREADQAKPISVDGRVVGTLPYLSPEQASGVTDEVDVRSDIYSLGVVLFQLITDDFPYPVKGDSLTVCQNILSREPTTLRKAQLWTEDEGGVNPADINDDLEKVVLKALQKDKSRRYQSAAAFADDLGRYLSGEAVEAKSASRLYLLRKALRKYRLPVGIAAGAGALLVVALIAITMAWRQAENVARIAQTGLQMGSYLRIGAVHRDEGRVGQAEGMFEKALELTKFLNTSDPLLLRQLFSAHQSLAELFYATDRADEARPHCEAASRFVEQLLQVEPENLQWRRYQGLLFTLRGRLALAGEDPETALREFERAESVYKELHALAPDSTSITHDVAEALSARGGCYRILDRFDESLQCFVAALDLYKGLAGAEPDVLDHAMEVHRTETKIAVWYQSRKTPEGDQTATEWFDRAEDGLKRLQNTEQGHTYEWRCRRILDGIEANRRVLAWRAKKREEATNTLNSHP